MITQLNPYVNLDGTAEQAIHFYENALGASARTVMRWGDTPDRDVAPETRQRIMHAELQVGEAVLMIADTWPDEPAPAAGGFQITLHFDDIADMTRRFEALAAGGTVTMAPHDTFFDAKFAMLTDRFGVKWQLICPK